MLKKIFVPVIVLVLAVSFLSSCKRTYFHLTEEVHQDRKLKFKTTRSYYEPGQAIELTAGGFRIIYGDNSVLYIAGKARIEGVGEPGIATLDFTEIASFYIALPIRIEVGERYDTRHNAICEIINSFAYDAGETLFTCQEGDVVVDSLKRGKFYGTFTGDYINTSNKHLSVEGDFKAGRK